MERVRKISESYPLLKQIEKASSGQVKGEHLFIAIAGVLFISLFCKCIASPITNLFAVLLVIGQATAIITSKTPVEPARVKHIISYLLTFSLFVTVDSLVPFAHRNVPFYYHVKLVLFYYLSIRNYQVTDYLNSTLYLQVQELVRRLNEIDPSATIKAARTAASEKVKDLSETVKGAAASKPAKEE
ncbi:hypothetical protein NEHOM01_1116 [Nematocida homosporus]|uniref:uncharacterized protein n=1 Tax=Nematocida homosporus TaxID=1912981 RepID=UPI00221EF510|nr:uncharacterized protein NEHOM01_1116 [Nematocida homosporus]KAI5185866.1 hypothetical protein NEHOM01_1116 [Nematocida homosporus]